MSQAHVPSDDRAAFDAVIIGGGPAGLSAALVLGRARRRTLVVDAGRPRNLPSPAAHGVFTRDGTSPGELLELARRQLTPYRSVELRHGLAVAADYGPGGFVVRLEDGATVQSRRLLLAVGVSDDLPPVAGLGAQWGTTVLHCAYCHGWEVRDEPLALYARGEDATKSAAMLLGWSRDLLLCTDGPADLSTEQRRHLAGRGVRIVDTQLLRVERAASQLRLVFADGEVEERRALFLTSIPRIDSPITDILGCERLAASQLKIDSDAQTSVPGVYAAGDVATSKKQVAIAAASGVEAAMMLNRDLAQEDFRLGGSTARLRLSND